MQATTSAASSSAVAAAIAATSTAAVAASSSSSSSAPALQLSEAAAAAAASASSQPPAADLSSIRSASHRLRTDVSRLSAASAAVSASSPSSFAALTEAFFELDELVAAHAASSAAQAHATAPDTSRSRIQQVQQHPQETKAASPDSQSAEAERLELMALLDAWRLQPSSSAASAPPSNAFGVLHPATLASLSRSVRSQLATHFLERLASAGSDAGLHAELANILAQILPPASPQADGQPLSLSTAQSQLCANLSKQLHSHILPSLSAFEWTRKRDLPPILSKAITRPSPAVFMLRSFLRGAATDAHATLNPSLVRPVLLSLLAEAAEGAREIYLCLGGSVSRFHSRQLFVDLASSFVVLRAAERALLEDKQDAAANPSAAAADASQVLRVHVALLELACGIVLTHPSLLPLRDLPALLAGWEQAWTEQRATGSQAASNSLGAPLEPLAAVDALLSKQLGMLWHCDADASAPAAAAAAPAPSFLSSFFAMPRLHLSGDADPVAAASAAGITPDTHWPSQRLDLGAAAACVPAEILSAPIVIALLSPSRLLRLVQMRHQLREADFPELEADEEAVATELRSSCARLLKAAAASL